MAKKNKAAGRNERDHYLASRWSDVYLPAARRAKKQFQKIADEVDEYFSGDHDHLYQELSEWLDFTGGLAMTVNLAFEVRGYLGPHLYHKNPVRTVVPTTEDSVLQFLCKVTETYLNESPNEHNLVEEARQGIDDTLLAGRGAMETYKDPVTGLVASRHVPIDDVLIDPDARSLDEAYWIAVARQEPLWKVRKRFGREVTRDLKANVTSDTEKLSEEDAAERGRTLSGERAFGETNDVIRYWVVWSKFGCGFRGKGTDETYKGDDDEKLYKKLVIVEGHDRPLYEGPWDGPDNDPSIPLYLDDDWPIGFLEFTPQRKGSKKKRPLWPISLMKAALSHQKAIDFSASAYMERVKVAARFIAAALGTTEEEVLDKVANGGLSELVRLSAADNGATRIEELLSVIEMPKPPRELLEWIAWNEEKFGEVTGLLPILKGGFGIEGGDRSQMRSATEAAVRDRNSRSRVDDMSDRAERWATGTARREAFAVRLVLTPSEVERVVRDKLPKKWKVRVTVGADELTVPDLKGTPEEPGLWPSAARYFDSPEEAQQVAAEIQQGAQAIAQAEGATKAPFMADVVPVTIRELWNDTQGMTAERLAREFHCRVEAGSARKPDMNLQAEQAQAFVDRVGAPALNMGDLQTYNKALEKLWDVLQVPKRDRVFLDAEFQRRQMEAQAQAQQAAQQQAAQQEAQEQAQEQAQEHQQDLQKLGAQAQADVKKEVVGAAVGAMFDPPGSGGVR